MRKLINRLPAPGPMWQQLTHRFSPLRRSMSSRIESLVCQNFNQPEMMFLRPCQKNSIHLRPRDWCQLHWSRYRLISFWKKVNRNPVVLWSQDLGNRSVDPNDWEWDLGGSRIFEIYSHWAHCGWEVRAVSWDATCCEISPFGSIGKLQMM